jgi:nucleoside 2-deoxyribosyltransferase
LASVREFRAQQAEHYLGQLLSNRLFVFSPIASSHRPAVQFDLPPDYHWWLEMDRAFIDAAAGVIVLMIPGWRESKGVGYEIEYAAALKKPVWYLDPMDFTIRTSP